MSVLEKLIVPLGTPYPVTVAEQLLLEPMVSGFGVHTTVADDCAEVSASWKLPRLGELSESPA